MRPGMLYENINNIKQLNIVKTSQTTLGGLTASLRELERFVQAAL